MQIPWTFSLSYPRSWARGLFLLLGVALLTSGCFGPPRSVTEPEGVTITRNIAIGERDGRQLALDLYRQEDASEAQPVALWIHGGGWLLGSRSPCPIARLALRGYTVAALEYRLSDDGQWPSQEQDLLQAVEWLRANGADYGIDPQRMVAWGASAGGHLALRLGHGPDPHVQAVVAWFPPTDLPRLAEDGGDWRMRMAIRRLIDGDPASDQAARQRAQEASADPDRLAVPVLIVHGDRDGYIPIEHSRDFIDHRQAAGGKAQLVELKNVGHGNWVLGNAHARRQAHRFIDAILHPQVPEGAPQ